MPVLRLTYVGQACPRSDTGVGSDLCRLLSVSAPTAGPGACLLLSSAAFKTDIREYRSPAATAFSRVRSCSSDTQQQSSTFSSSDQRAAPAPTTTAEQQQQRQHYSTTHSNNIPQPSATTATKSATSVEWQHSAVSLVMLHILLSSSNQLHSATTCSNLQLAVVQH